MDSNDFWCRAFLAEMNGTCSRTMVNWEHERAAERFEKAADAALAVAQRRGMVGEQVPLACRTIALPPPDDRPCSPDELRQLRRVAQIACAWVCGGHDGERLLREAVSEWWHAEGVRLDAAMRGEREAPKPKLERVEFTAEPADHGQWALRSPKFGGSEAAILVVSERESFNCNGSVVRIKWGETMPPKPIEVWIERGG